MVLSWFDVNLVGEGAVELPMDLSMVVKESESAGSGHRVSLVGREAGARALGIK